MMAATPSPAKKKRQKTHGTLELSEDGMQKRFYGFLLEGFGRVKQLRTHMSGKTRRSDCEKDTILFDVFNNIALGGSFELFWLVAGYRKSEYGPKVSRQISPFLPRSNSMQSRLTLPCTLLAVNMDAATVPLLDLELNFQSASGSVDPSKRTARTLKWMV